MLINSAPAPKVSSPNRHDREKIQKKVWAARNDPFGRESSRQPVIPPAPLTGDAGRGCGDASRAPNFLAVSALGSGVHLER
jgi:hypothetical protein